MTDELDLVFCCDCTASMGSYIESAKTNIRKISEKVHAMEAKSMRYGLVCYRDHPPQDTSYATKTFPLTPSISTMQSYVNTMSAEGGGDGPESVACALYEALNFDWRKNAVKVCVIIADAPPHGIGASGDGFPNGCPCGHDPLKVAKQMAEKKIVIYSVAVEPSLGNYSNGRAFFSGIAKLTHGRFLDLGQAELLPEVIIGGSVEELDLKKVEEELSVEYNKVKAESPTLGQDALMEAVHKNLASKGVTTWHLDVTEQDAHIANDSIFSEADSLKKAMSKLGTTTTTTSTDTTSTDTTSTTASPLFSSFSLPSFTLPSFLTDLFGSSTSSASLASNPMYSGSSSAASNPLYADSSSSHSYASQEAKVYKDTISKEQVTKIMTKNNLM